MECPNCSNTQSLELAEDNKGSSCSECGGIWFSQETLIALCEAHDYDPNIVNLHLSEEKKRHASKNCPVCKTRLITSSISEVELDWCENGHGVWFDKGEYDSVVTNSPESSFLDRTSAAITIVDVIFSIGGLLR